LTGTALTGTALTGTALTSTALTGAPVLPDAVGGALLAGALRAEAGVLAGARLAGTALGAEAAVLAANLLTTASTVARWPWHAGLAVLAKLAVADAILAEPVVPQPSDRDFLHSAWQLAGLTGAGLAAAVVGCPVRLETGGLHAGLPVGFLAGVPATLAEARRELVASGGGRLLVLLPLRMLALRLLSRGLWPHRRLRLCVHSYRGRRLSQLWLSQLWLSQLWLSHLWLGQLLLRRLVRWPLWLQRPARCRFRGPGLRSLRGLRLCH